MIIVNNPTNLPNGILINGVANFYIATKPTTRVDGSALIVQDIWNDTTNGIRWVYSGAVWRSAVFDVELNNGLGSSHNAFPAPPTNCTTIYIKDFVLAQQSGNINGNDASNYGTYNANIRAKAGGLETTLASIQNFPLSILNANNWIATVNQAFTLSTYSGVLERAGVTVGTNGAYTNYVSKLTCQWQI